MFSIFILCASIVTIVGVPSNNDANKTDVQPEHTQFPVTFILPVKGLESNTTNIVNTTVAGTNKLSPEVAEVDSAAFKETQQDSDKTKNLLLHFPNRRPTFNVFVDHVYINSTFIQNTNTNSTLTNDTNTGDP